MPLHPSSPSTSARPQTTATGLREPSLAADGSHYAINSGNTLYAIDPFGAEE